MCDILYLCMCVRAGAGGGGGGSGGGGGGGGGDGGGVGDGDVDGDDGGAAASETRQPTDDARSLVLTGLVGLAGQHAESAATPVTSAWVTKHTTMLPTV